MTFSLRHLHIGDRIKAGLAKVTGKIHDLGAKAVGAVKHTASTVAHKAKEGSQKAVGELKKLGNGGVKLVKQGGAAVVKEVNHVLNIPVAGIKAIGEETKSVLGNPLILLGGAAVAVMVLSR
jgi:hypothetical protein